MRLLPFQGACLLLAYDSPGRCRWAMELAGRQPAEVYLFYHLSFHPRPDVFGGEDVAVEYLMP